MKPWAECAECGFKAESSLAFRIHLDGHADTVHDQGWYVIPVNHTVHAQWSDADSVMVLVNPDPSCPSDVRVRYPGSHDAKVPVGYERVYLRNLQEVNRFEKQHGVANHRMHYDNNGNALDDHFRGDKMVH